jgi:hypothetical protein
MSLVVLLSEGFAKQKYTESIIWTRHGHKPRQLPYYISYIQLP